MIPTELIAINGSDRDWTHHRYVLCFGAYGWTRLMVWANSLEDALDGCVDWIADNAPGLLADEQVKEAYREACEEMGIPHGTEGDDPRCLEAWEQATADTMCTGNAGHYLLSWEWGIIAEDPTREEILRLQGRAA